MVTDINDNPPQFGGFGGFFTARISEDAAVGDTLNVQFGITDADEGINAAIHFSFLNGNERGHFRIDEATGVITVMQPLDYESQVSYLLVTAATDGGVPTALQTTSQVFLQVRQARLRWEGRRLACIQALTWPLAAGNLTLA